MPSKDATSQAAIDCIRIHLINLRIGLRMVEFPPTLEHARISFQPEILPAAVRSEHALQ
jgi:hypothetical protein